MPFTFSTDRNQSTSFATFNSDDVISVTPEAHLAVTGAFAFTGNGSGNLVFIAGRVTATNASCVQIIGNSNTLQNLGSMVAVGTNSVAFFDGNNNRIFNSGTISRHSLNGQGAIIFHDTGGGNLLDNSASGIIEGFGTSAVALLDSKTGRTNTIVNRGIIRISDANQSAIDAGTNEGNTIVTNTGTIQGNVELGSGNDVFNSAAGIFVGTALGGAGTDTLLGGSLGEGLNGGDGNDVIDGGGGIDTLTGGAGGDLIRVDNASDVVIEVAGGGNDVVEASASYALAANVEVLRGIGGAALTLTGSDGAETIIANNAGDRLVGGAGADQLVGGAGNDTFVFDGVDQITDTAGGFDTVETAGSLTILPGIEALVAVGTDAISLFGSANADRLTGNGVANNLSGGAGDDTLFGQAGNDVLSGGDGTDNLDGGLDADKLFGGTGNDTLFGQAGNDRLAGNTGKDVLRGGSGRDIFVFDKALSKTTNIDRILDFNVTDDTIGLDNAVMKALGKAGRLSSDAFVKDTVAREKAHHVIYNPKTGILAYDSDGVGGAAQITIATLATNLKMTSADILVI